MSKFSLNEPLYPALCREGLLWKAWKLVRQKQSAGGIDYVSVQDFQKKAQQHIHNLGKQLKSASYVPEPYLEVQIPKAKGEKRRLGLLSIKDKVVQQAILLLIGDEINKILLPSCYAYRPKWYRQ